MPASASPAGALSQTASAGTGSVATPERRAFPGRPEQVAQARRFVARVLDGCPIAEAAVLCVSEVATNAIMHTRTGQGGMFEIVVWRGPGSACVSVVDEGSETSPVPGRPVPGRPVSGELAVSGDLAVSGELAAPEELAESGHGLAVVEELSACWGHHRGHDGSWRGVVWFRLDWRPT